MVAATPANRIYFLMLPPWGDWFAHRVITLAGHLGVVKNYVWHVVNLVEKTNDRDDSVVEVSYCFEVGHCSPLGLLG